MVVKEGYFLAYFSWSHPFIHYCLMVYWWIFLEAREILLEDLDRPLERHFAGHTDGSWLIDGLPYSHSRGDAYITPIKWWIDYT